LDTRNRAGGPAPLVDGGAASGLSAKGVAAFVAALLFPGAGHALLGRWARALLLAVLLLGTFGLGLLLHGKVYSYNETALSVFYMFADFGTGLIYLVCRFTGIGVDAQPAVATFEYGTNLICVAGLLNYLVALDAYDIAVGRKA
jgi:hypothetical protein